MFLTELTRKIPRSFFSRSLDPFLGMVATVAFLMKFGISPCLLRVLNRFRSDTFRFEPIIEDLKIVLTRPSGSYALFDLSPFRTCSRSSIFKIGVFLFLADFSFILSSFSLIGLRALCLG